MVTETIEIEVCSTEDKNLNETNEHKCSASDKLQVSGVEKKKKRPKKSPTPLSTTSDARDSSMTPTRNSRSLTPFSLYLARHSEDPSAPPKWRSITPFIDRKDKEKTPFELGNDIKAQLICHKMVFDRASIMDISDETEYEPARYLTSDISVIDRASVMDISNVEVIYLVEEYEEEEVVEEVQPAKKKKAKRVKKEKSVEKSVEKEDSPGGSVEKKTKSKKKIEKKKKEKDEDDFSPPPASLPKLTLKLELRGGSKMNKKMFEKKPSTEAKPPPKKSKLAMQMEEQAKAAAKAAAEAVARQSEKSKEKENSIDDEDDEEDEEEDLIEEQDNPEEDIQVAVEQELDEFNVMENAETDAVELDENIDTDEIEAEIFVEEEIIKEATPPPPPPRSPSPALPPPRPESYYKKIAQQEGEEFCKKIRMYNSVKHDKPHHPAFIVKLKDICATETQTIKLVCAIIGPETSFKWFKDDIIVKENDRVTFLEDDNILSMQIADCRPGDTAEYTCTIFNEYKKVSCNSYVNVCEMGGHQDEPCAARIEFIEDSYHYLDDKLLIECKVKGIPRPKITWFKEDSQLYDWQVEYTFVEQGHGCCMLIINHPTPLDSGIYTVHAENSRGVDVRKHCVEFFGTKPHQQLIRTPARVMRFLC